MAGGGVWKNRLLRIELPNDGSSDTGVMKGSGGGRCQGPRCRATAASWRRERLWRGEAAEAEEEEEAARHAERWRLGWWRGGADGLRRR